MTPINVNKAMPELNSFASIRAGRAVAGDSRADLVSRNFDSLAMSKRFCADRFSDVLEKFKSAVIAGDKAMVAELTKFPLSMPYGVKAVKNKISCAGITKSSKVRPMPPNVLQAPNREKNPLGAMRSAALLKRQITGRTYRFASSLN
jgi:hypothetical protein